LAWSHAEHCPRLRYSHILSSCFGASWSGLGVSWRLSSCPLLVAQTEYSGSSSSSYPRVGAGGCVARAQFSPFFPLHSCDLKHLTLRTVFLVAVTSEERASEHHAHRHDTALRRPAEFVLLQMSLFFLKLQQPSTVLNQWLWVLFPVDAEGVLRKLCVFRSLAEYIDRTIGLYGDA